MAMGDPAKEPGNPDGCKMDKKKISKMASSLANLADMFSRAATLIENAVNSIANSVRKVGKGTGRSGGGGGGVKDTITTPEEFNKSVKRIKKAQEKKEKEIYEANMASIKAEIDAREEEEKEIINAAMRGLSARNAIRLSAEAEENKAQKKEAEARKKHHDDLFKQQEKSANEQMKQLESFQKRQAADLEKYRKDEEKEISDEQKEIIKNAKRLLSALNKATRNAWKKAEAAARQAEKEASNEADRQEKEIIDNSISLLSALNKATRNAWKEAERAAQEEENEIIKNAMRGLSARNAIRDRAEKEAERAAQEEENEIIRNAMRGLSARNAIRLASEKEMEARKKFFEDQERDIMRQAPIAYSIGKALGFITGSLFQAASGLFSKGNKGPQGKATGGWIQAFASGGAAKGTDTVPAMLTPGEFVVNKKSAQKNRGILKSINDGTQYYAAGGYVGAMSRGVDATRRGAGAAIGGATAGLEAAGISSLTGGLQALNAVVGAAATGFKVLTASALAPVDMFNKLTSFAGSFVEAVNPALMQQLSLVFKDLQAIIGVGLQPVIAAAVPIIRAFADKLQPVMQALMPTFDQLAQSMIQLSGPVITLLIEGFAALEPVISIASMAVQALADVLTAIAPIISTVFKEIVFRVTSLATTLQWLIGKMISWIPGTGDTGKKLMESADAAQKTADMYYAGASQVQKAVKEPVKKGASVGAAAQSASFKGISDFGKGLMQAAFSSSTQAAALKTAEYSEKTYNELANMNARMGRVDPAAPAAGVRRAGP